MFNCSIALFWCLLSLVLVKVNANNPTAYEREQLIPLYYNKLFSQRTQIPYKYATQPFICPPYTDSSWHHKQRLTSWLVADQDWRGDWLIQSDYKIATLDNVDCNVLCTKPWSLQDAIVAKELIEQDYQVEWWLDGLPGATASYTNEVSTRAYRVGFPLGQIKNNHTFINNHVTFNILYTPSHDRIQVLGFEVYPDSVANGQCTHTAIDYTMQEVNERRTSVTFTYSVRWKEAKNPLTPAKLPLTPQTRWDMYIITPDPETHFYAMINSIITILFLLGVVGVILMKTLQRDQQQNYHDDHDLKIHEDFEDVIGWRLIHRDVFRRPIYGGLLAPLVGSGIQLVVAAVGTLVCMVLGTSHPAQPGSLFRTAFVIYMLSSILAGYHSARIYKVFRGRSWFLNTILTAILVPVLVLGSLLLESISGWTLHSSRTMSVKGWFTLMILWLVVMLPLTFLGSLVGDRRERIEHPSRTTQMPRFIPEKRWYQSYSMSVLLGGVIPFAIVFVDLDELLKSVWQGELYLSLGYASMACMLLGVATASVTVVLVFFQLCNEDYHWWWMSFAVGASCSLYTFIYALVFYWIRTDMIGMASGMVYLVHTLVGCLLLGLCTGTLGFISTYSVIRRIYAAVKVD
ncbi:hypothetical protein O0I10_003227 [Lichtheimia ornata]|uniref:Transmembrane 9 superfamily member n=1 Tax=Lichtheimia ornata TaxID=688661 RepID=A0AAD7V9X4_9FUNG|nr:uncharacterized protein O0I10_003227 [Lichtheimia ornata]KAJ8661005.1 hypothetical protein O0I10_003227 [Lichtheimia ornata]